MNIRRRVTAFVSRWPLGRADVLFLSGAGCIVYGVHLLLPPLAWIVGGIVPAGLGSWMYYREGRRS